jgi:hypothetical protein
MVVSGQLHAASALTPDKGAPGTHWIGGSFSSRAGLDLAVEKRVVGSLPGIETSCSAHSLVAVCGSYTDCFSVYIA